MINFAIITPFYALWKNVNRRISGEIFLSLSEKKKKKETFMITKYDNTDVYIFNLNKNFIPPCWSSDVCVLWSQECKCPLASIYLV